MAVCIVGALFVELFWLVILVLYPPLLAINIPINIVIGAIAVATYFIWEDEE